MATGSDSPRGPAAGTAAGYRETLRTPWWWYLVAIGVACLLAAEFRIGGLPLTSWVPFVVLIPLFMVFVWWLGRSRLEVKNGELHIQGAHLPLDLVTGTVGLDPRTLRLVVGREGDPAAFVQIRPWVGPGVQLWLDDPEDPTPYWIVSTRHPQRLISVVNAAR